jgi:hypothetical protein
LHSQPHVTHSRGGKVQSSPGQQADVVLLAARVRQMCLQHDDCADAAVDAAARMAGTPLQQLLVSAAGNPMAAGTIVRGRSTLPRARPLMCAKTLLHCLCRQHWKAQGRACWQTTCGPAFIAAAMPWLPAPWAAEVTATRNWQ